MMRTCWVCEGPEGVLWGGEKLYPTVFNPNAPPYCCPNCQELYHKAFAPKRPEADPPQVEDVPF